MRDGFNNPLEGGVEGVYVDMAWMPEYAARYVIRKCKDAEGILSALGIGQKEGKS